MAQFLRPNSTLSTTGTVNIIGASTAHEAVDEITSNTTDRIQQDANNTAATAADQADAPQPRAARHRPEGTRIIGVVLPSGERIDAWYDRSTTPGAWRNNADDSPVTEWRDGEVVRVQMLNGVRTAAYWDAETEAAWTGQEDNPADRMLIEAELNAVDYVDLRKQGVD